MAKQPITTEEIHQAADRIIENGERPTLARVRAELGGGSFTTISEAMKLHRQKKAEAETIQTVEVPELVGEALDQAGTYIWNAAITIAENRLEDEREALAETRQRMEEAQAETAEMADQMEKEIQELRAELENTRAEAEKADKEAAELLEDAIKSAERASKNYAEEQIKLESAYARIATLSTDIEKVREGEKVALTEAAELRGRLSTAGEQLTLYKEKAEAAAAAQVQAETALNSTQTQLQTARADLEGIRTRAAAQDEELTAAAVAKAEVEKTLAVAQAKAEGMERELLQKDTENRRLDLLLQRVTTVPKTQEPAAKGKAKTTKRGPSA